MGQVYETKDLINEVKQGREFAKQLQIHLNVASSTHETREYLAHKVIGSFDKVLAMLNSTTDSTKNQQGGMELIGSDQSPPSFSGSPRSEDSDREFKNPDDKLNASRKRKAMPRWTKQVKIQPRTGIEGSLDDKYSWRKYGQKDILGYKYPRCLFCYKFSPGILFRTVFPARASFNTMGYYRCTHRHVQGCLATKQVQRSDNDSRIFEITYRGRHTCSDHAASNLTPQPSERSEPLVTNQDHDHQLHDQQQNQQEVLLSFKTGLTVITDDLDSYQQINPTSFYFTPSTSNNNINNSENYSLSHYYMLGDNNINTYSPSFVSPASSSSNYNLSVSPSFVSPASSSSNYNLSVSPSNLSSFGGNFQNLQASDNELTEIISAATSTTNSPTVGLNYQFGDQVEFNSNFTFNNPGFFS